MEETEVWKRSEASVVKRQKMIERQVEVGTRKRANSSKAVKEAIGDTVEKLGLFQCGCRG